LDIGEDVRGGIFAEVINATLEVGIKVNQVIYP
jgi:hypothetical protein